MKTIFKISGLLLSATLFAQDLSDNLVEQAQSASDTVLQEALLDEAALQQVGVI